MQGGNRTIVFATHVIEEVRRVADYAVFHFDGVFLGLHEKDALLEQRKTLWVDREPVGDVPGVVSRVGARHTSSPTRRGRPATHPPRKTYGSFEAGRYTVSG